MTRSPPVRALTGCVCHKAKRDVADHAREMHLSTAEVGLRDLIERITEIFKYILWTHCAVGALRARDETGD